MRIPIIALSLLLAALSSCKEGTDHTFDGFWAYWLMQQDHRWYNNCSVQPTVLSPGTHQVALAQGGEYWFDFTSREHRRELAHYEVTVQEQPGQDVKAVYLDCMTSGQRPPFTMGDAYLADSGSAGALEAYTIPISGTLQPVPTGELAIVLKSLTGSGTIDLTIPISSL